MPTEPIFRSALGVDLTPRFVTTTTVVASPSAAAETIIAQLPAINAGVAYQSGVFLICWVAFTVGTNGTAVQLKIRQTNVSGSTIVATGALTGSQHGAGILSDDNVHGFDASPAAGQVYVLTMQVTAGSAPSTVSAVSMLAIAI